MGVMEVITPKMDWRRFVGRIITWFNAMEKAQPYLAVKQFSQLALHLESECARIRTNIERAVRERHEIIRSKHFPKYSSMVRVWLPTIIKILENHSRLGSIERIMDEVIGTGGRLGFTPVRRTNSCCRSSTLRP